MGEAGVSHSSHSTSVRSTWQETVIAHSNWKIQAWNPKIEEAGSEAILGTPLVDPSLGYLSKVEWMVYESDQMQGGFPISKIW